VQTVELDEEALRDVFNGAELWEKRMAGDLMEVVDRNSTPRLENKQPRGTRSITSHLYDARSGMTLRTVAVVHYYRLPDGTINNERNAPDPKMCIVEGVKYVLKPKSDAAPPPGP